MISHHNADNVLCAVTANDGERRYLWQASASCVLQKALLINTPHSKTEEETRDLL